MAAEPKDRMQLSETKNKLAQLNGSVEAIQCTKIDAVSAKSKRRVWSPFCCVLLQPKPLTSTMHRNIQYCCTNYRLRLLSWIPVNRTLGMRESGSQSGVGISRAGFKRQSEFARDTWTTAPLGRHHQQRQRHQRTKIQVTRPTRRRLPVRLRSRPWRSLVT